MAWKELFKKNTPVQKNRTSAMTVQYAAGQARFTPRQYDQLAKEGYQKNVIAYRCIKLISQNAAAVQWNVYQGTGSVRQKLEDHDLILLLRQPNPLQGTAEFIESVIAYYLIAGNSYSHSK